MNKFYQFRARLGLGELTGPAGGACAFPKVGRRSLLTVALIRGLSAIGVRRRGLSLGGGFFSFGGSARNVRGHRLAFFLSHSPAWRRMV